MSAEPFEDYVVDWPGEDPAVRIELSRDAGAALSENPIPAFGL